MFIHSEILFQFRQLPFDTFQNLQKKNNQNNDKILTLNQAKITLDFSLRSRCDRI